ncbi:methyl-accepting chemotaxis sensory transducer [Ruegeria sp. TM1040]|uniref:methyl-accepting chemotaxis protein n=1 Tax=Ruegeria sp. (strain TM1040) TaxID=292414 RepID=UPI0000557AFD|nr:methyl-accepting chemotaxis protein [Ruegeria sp. TM1040]ABF63092.1 methyl-accepting chemotaxis sensory transducer [Ruegeria sp. TM1040]
MPKLKTSSSIKRPGFGVFRSIRAKMSLILFVMGASFCVFAYMIHTVLSGIDRDMTTLNSKDLPGLELAGEISLASEQAKNTMLSLISATEVSVIDTASREAEAAAEHMMQLIGQLDAEMQPVFEAQATQVAGALSDLADARRDALNSEAQIEAEIEAFNIIVNDLGELMTGLVQAASVELNRGAANTYDAIDKSLKLLVERDFHNLELLLEARAELNLLAGAAVAFGGTKDKETIARLQALADSSDARLQEISEEIEANAPEMLDVSLIHSALFTLQSVIAQSLFPSESLRQAAMKSRADTDRFIVMAIDAQLLKLSASAARTSKENGDTLRELMTNEVGFLNVLMEISQHLNSFQVAALDVLTASDEQQVKDAAFSLSQASRNLANYTDFQDPLVVELLSRVAAFAEEEAGLAALRMNELSARAAAQEATQKTEATVLEIADRASEFAAQTLGVIRTMSSDISGEVATASRNMVISLAMAAGVFLTALLVTQLLILRPLNRISASTERLAEGDRSPVTGFERTSTEIYRIARSLSVFRDGIVEKEELEEMAAAERQERERVQAKAVEALGTGLERLSSGDLTGHIHEELGEGYDRLRLDFNRTLDTLNDTVGQVIDTSASIRNGASEISQASQDLSHRTESQAATLEETAAALDEMTASVTSAAEGARDVERTSNEARSEAEASGDIVRSAVSAMTEIEQSSGKIAQIISVIDDIAFQTNLLALNAGVEAARAGEAGRGFAVVASEVRGLAQRSSDAALEIKNLISDSSKQVERGVDLVGKAGEALDNILNRVSHVSELISGIATGAQEQSTGLLEINTGMNQLDQVTQQNAAMVEEATAASQLLNTDAETLADLVARFQTANTARTPAAGAGDVGEDAGSEALAPTSWGDAQDIEWEATEVEEPFVPEQTDWSDFDGDDTQATGT